MGLKDYCTGNNWGYMIYGFTPISVYIGPSILRPLTGPRKCGLILQMALK